MAAKQKGLLSKRKARKTPNSQFPVPGLAQLAWMLEGRPWINSNNKKRKKVEFHQCLPIDEKRVLSFTKKCQHANKPTPSRRIHLALMAVMTDKRNANSTSLSTKRNIRNSEGQLSSCQENTWTRPLQSLSIRREEVVRPAMGTTVKVVLLVK